MRVEKEIILTQQAIELIFLQIFEPHKDSLCQVVKVKIIVLALTNLACLFKIIHLRYIEQLVLLEN